MEFHNQKRQFENAKSPAISLLPRLRRPLAMAILLTVSGDGVNAATISVADNGDSGTALTCTLRQAITAITARSTSGTDCIASGVFGQEDAVELPTTVSTITLSEGSLSVKGTSTAQQTLAIEGSGQTIDANHLGSVFYVYQASLSITSLTLTGSHASSGGGIYATRSSISLTDSTISGNVTQYFGGGIFVQYGTVTLTNSTVAGNSAENGGGLYAVASTVTITNSTVSGNSGSNGGGIDAPGGTVTLNNTLLSGNSASNGPDLFTGSLSSANATYSLLGTALNVNAPPFPFANPANHNVFSDAPGLSPLANNGGNTPTMALNEASPALNAGSTALAIDPISLAKLNYDQRGGSYARTLNGKVDIGAYQHQGDRLFVNGFESSP